MPPSNQLLNLLTEITHSHLKQQLEFLKIENTILRKHCLHKRLHLEERNITTLKIPHRSPNLNPYAESWVATVKRECLDHFLVIGKVHLEYLVKKFIDYYNNHRPHSSMDNQPLENCPVKMDGEIHAKPILGGLAHHYYRK